MVSNYYEKEPGKEKSYTTLSLCKSQIREREKRKKKKEKEKQQQKNIRAEIAEEGQIY